jgi:glutamyl-tRNA reductase
VEANRRARAGEVERARLLIADAVGRLGRAAAARTAAPTIRSLRAKLEEFRQAEIERTLARLGDRLGDRGPEVRAALDAMSTTLVNKILHGPIEQLKAAQAAPGGARFRALVREMFGLDCEDHQSEGVPEES